MTENTPNIFFSEKKAQKHKKNDLVYMIQKITTDDGWNITFRVFIQSTTFHTRQECYNNRLNLVKKSN